MLYKFNSLPRISLIISVFAILSGCTSATSTSSTYYYTDSWWHDDFWFYQDHVYPNCCVNDDELKEVVENWWHTLDPDKQEQIKDKVEGWKEGNGPDFSALKNDFNQKFESLPAEKQQALTEKREAIRQKVSGQSLSADQKQALQSKWQSKKRPTLDRAPSKPKITRPNIKPNRPVTRPATRPSFGGGRLGGRKR